MSSRSGVAILFVLAHLVLLLMMAFTFPRINAQIGAQAFDLRPFGYSLEEATLILQNLDQATTNFYIFPQLLLLDILYPVLLALFLSTLIIRLVNLIWQSPKHIYSSLFVLPFIAMFADYLENTLILVMLLNPATVSSGIIKVASIATQLKGFVTTVSWLVIVVLFVIWLWKKWNNRSGQETKTFLQ